MPIKPLPVIPKNILREYPKGKLWPTKGKRSKKGIVNQCHRNSSKLWFNNQSDYSIVTGYVCVADRWYEHTWLLDKDNHIVDTTLKNGSAYYGVLLSRKEAKEFAANEGVSEDYRDWSKQECENAQETLLKLLLSQLSPEDAKTRERILKKKGWSGKDQLDMARINSDIAHVEYANWWSRYKGDTKILLKELELWLDKPTLKAFKAKVNL